MKSHLSGYKMNLTRTLANYAAAGYLGLSSLVGCIEMNQGKVANLEDALENQNYALGIQGVVNGSMAQPLVINFTEAIKNNECKKESYTENEIKRDRLICVDKANGARLEVVYSFDYAGNVVKVIVKNLAIIYNLGPDGKPVDVLVNNILPKSE